MNLVDSSGWLEYFIGGENSDFFASAIEDKENLMISSINLYEVLKKLLQTNDIKKALVYLTSMKAATQINVDEEIAYKAVLLSNEFKLPMADSLLYATAKVHNATFYTQDQNFENIADVKFIKKTY